MTPPLEESFQKACADGVIPGAVLLAANQDGMEQINFRKGFQRGADHVRKALSNTLKPLGCDPLKRKSPWNSTR